MTDASVRDLFLGFEQLEVIRDLLLVGSPVEARMALILLDGLADSMLFRRLEDLYEASEDPWRRKLGNIPHYTRETRHRARQGFNRRVGLARHRVPHLFGGDEEWLSAEDADVLRVCHAYRNIAYHEDAHNPNVVASVARMHYAVVARLLAHLQPSGWSRGSTSEARIEQLAEWGYETGSMLNVREAADAVAEHLIAALPVDASELRETLAEDLEARAKALREDVRFLADSTLDGPEKLIENMELSTHYAADEELLELQDQFNPFLLVESGVTEPTDEWIEQARAATVRFHERVAELERQHKQRVTLRLIDSAVRKAARLRGMPDTNTTRMLIAYHDVDSPLTELETYVGKVVLAVDREIQLQIDIKRGK